MSDTRSRKLQEMAQRQMEIVQQLRAEKRLQRKKVSSTVADMVAFMESKANEDFLVRGFHKPSDNPYLEKGKCTIV